MGEAASDQIDDARESYFLAPGARRGFGCASTRMYVYSAESLTGHVDESWPSVVGCTGSVLCRANLAVSSDCTERSPLDGAYGVVPTRDADSRCEACPEIAAKGYLSTAVSPAASPRVAAGRNTMDLCPLFSFSFITAPFFLSFPCSPVAGNVRMILAGQQQESRLGLGTSTRC